MSTATTRTVIFPVSRSPEREPYYLWLAPLHRERLLLDPRNSRLNLSDSAKTRQRRIGLLPGSLMAIVLKEQSCANIVEASSVPERLRFLERGIVDVRRAMHDLVKDGTHARILRKYDLKSDQ